MHHHIHEMTLDAPLMSRLMVLEHAIVWHEHVCGAVKAYEIVRYFMITRIARLSYEAVMMYESLKVYIGKVPMGSRCRPSVVRQGQGASHLCEDGRGVKV